MTHRFHRNREGFALIITVVLVAFLVLILVGLATFTRVETQVADNTADVAKARQNAMEGLNIALGQLQRHAGIDTATTARGDLFGYNDKRKNLTSVWSSISGGAWTERVWLVSGSEPNESLANTLADVEDPTGTEDNTNFTNVFLVGDNSVEDDADRILVKRQPMTTEASNIPGLTGNVQTKIGHYAYWVGDEGAKVSLNVIDPTRLTGATNPSGPLPAYGAWTDGPTRARLNQQMLGQPQLANLNSSLNGIDITNAATVAQLLKVEANQALSFVNGFPGANQSQRIRELFHDVTPRAEAVLADLTSGDGRLKVDLSDTTKGTQAVRDYIGIPFTASSDYTSVHEVTASSFPVITEASIRLSFYRDTSSVPHRIRLAYQLDVETWNPYASVLRYTSDGDSTKGTGETDHITIELAGLPSKVDLATNGTTPTSVNDLDLDAILEGPTFTDANLSSGGAGTDLLWQPGQFKNLGTQGGDMLVEITSGSPASPRVSAWTQNLNGTDDTQIAVTYGQIINTLEVRLKVNGTTVSTYKPNQTFTGGDTSTGASTPENFCLGYGVQFTNNLQHFAESEDPRQANLPNSCFEEITWESDPELNVAKTFDSTDDFNFDAGTPKQIALFDLRRQEIVSVGQLRHLIGNAPYRSANGFYDDHFFSTRPSSGWSSADIVTQPLANRYLRLIKPVQLQPAVADVDSDLLDGDRSARYLLQTGAFNINSTSIPAWRALLGGSKLANWTRDADGLSTTTATPPGVTLNHAYFRFGHGGQFLTNEPLSMTDINDGVKVLFTAGRELRNTGAAPEIDRLAAEIVAEIKEWVADNGRNPDGSPFLSLEEFANSNVVRDAINDVTATDNLINDGLPAQRGGTPGALTQEDVIAAIAPLITPRSDTFKIRAYGDVYNPVTGAVTTRAWCEAVVQRMPDLAEDLDLPVETGAAGETVHDPDFDKYPFGRKFIVVSFRWLTTNDI